jgi:hypothetical protein
MLGYDWRLGTRFTADVNLFIVGTKCPTKGIENRPATRTSVGASSFLQKIGPDQSTQAYTTSSTSISSRARPATTMAARLG